MAWALVGMGLTVQSAGVGLSAPTQYCGQGPIQLAFSNGATMICCALLRACRHCYRRPFGLVLVPPLKKTAGVH